MGEEELQGVGVEARRGGDVDGAVAGEARETVEGGGLPERVREEVG